MYTLDGMSHSKVKHYCLHSRMKQINHIDISTLEYTTERKQQPRNMKNGRKCEKYKLVTEELSEIECGTVCYIA